MRFGPGLRWSFMGTFMIYRIAGGEAGMRHFMAQFGPALKWPWTKLMDVPELTDELLDRISRQSDEQAGRPGRSASWRALRDDCLVEVMHGLRTPASARARRSTDFEQAFRRGPARPTSIARDTDSIYDAVPTEWVDYNGHTNDSRYMQISSEAGDTFMRLDRRRRRVLGRRPAATSRSRATSSSREATPASGSTSPPRCRHDPKRLHIFHRCIATRRLVVATGEHM